MLLLSKKNININRKCFHKQKVEKFIRNNHRIEKIRQKSILVIRSQWVPAALRREIRKVEDLY